MVESKKTGEQEMVAITQLATFLLKKVFTILKFRKTGRKHLKAIASQVQNLSNERLKKRVVREIVSSYVIEPRLDALGETHFKRKQL